jgi:hypothetical protein
MEPALGGVKSNKYYSQRSLQSDPQLSKTLERALASVYLRVMNLGRSATAYDRFLRQLRAGGRTNMYGAVPYLMKAFGVDRHTAFAVVCEWLDRQAELSGEDLATTKPVRHR